MPGSFFDTNVLLYIAAVDPAKADRAEELIGAGGMISVQVLNEITNVARRKVARVAEDHFVSRAIVWHRPTTSAKDSVRLEECFGGPRLIICGRNVWNVTPSLERSGLFGQTSDACFSHFESPTRHSRQFP